MATKQFTSISTPSVDSIENDPAAKLLEGLGTLRGYAKTAAKHGRRLSSHVFYSQKARECLTALRHDYLLLRSEYVPNRAPKIAKQLEALEGPLSEIEKGLDLPANDLVRVIDRIAFTVGSDLRAALKAKPQDGLNGETFITTEILPPGVYRKVLDEANRSFAQNCPNACAAMLRRLVESLIIEAFETKSVEARIKDTLGEYLELKALIGKAIAEPALKLTRNTRNALPNLKFLGDMSVHARRNLVRPDDLKGVRNDARVAIEELASYLPLKAAS